MVKNVPSPAQPLNSSTECRGACYGQCVDDPCGVDATIVPKLHNLEEAVAHTFSDQNEGVKGMCVCVCEMSVNSQMDRHLRVLSLRVSFTGKF